MFLRDEFTSPISTHAHRLFWLCHTALTWPRTATGSGLKMQKNSTWFVAFVLRGEARSDSQHGCVNRRAGTSVGCRQQCFSQALPWEALVDEIIMRAYSMSEWGSACALLTDTVMLIFSFLSLLHSDPFSFLEVWNSLWFSCKLWENEHIQIWMDLCRQTPQLMVLALSVPFEAVSETFTCSLIFLFFFFCFEAWQPLYSSLSSPPRKQS